MTDITTLKGELFAPLTEVEQLALAEAEQVIERGLKTFVEVGNALTAINESRLYRTSHQSFEAYAKERWNLSRPRAYELMTAAEVMSAMADTEQLPSNERQVRELAKVPEPERADVWRETVERTEGKPTAAAVAETAKRAAEQRDARALLRRIVDLTAPANRRGDFVEAWAKQLGHYDEELSGLVKGAADAITVLDDLIERAGQ
jgi:hypothetical protein